MMVALAVLAVVSLAVLDLGGDNVRGLHDMEERTLARWVAENELAELRLERRRKFEEGARRRRDEEGEERGVDVDDAKAPRPKAEPLALGTRRERVRQGERTWQVVRETHATKWPWLRRVVVTVYALEEDRETTPVDTLTTFVGSY